MLLTLFLTFLKIGAFTFGGGYAMLALLEHELIDKKDWLTREEFLDMIAVAESTPGPLAVNSATYLGYRLGAAAGAAASTLAVCLPSFFVIYAISLVFDRFLSLTYVTYAFRGIQVCVVYLILSAGLKMLKGLRKKPLELAVLLTVLTAMTVCALLATLGVILPSFVIILLIAAVLKNLMKYAGVNAFLSGVRPCVVAMILATALSMALSTLLGFSGLQGGLHPDIRALGVFVVLAAVHFLWKALYKKSPPPIAMIGLSAVLGILLWGI